MFLYCACGYPLLVTAIWNGNDYHLVLHDSASAPGHDPHVGRCRHIGHDRLPITTCPQCGQPLVVRELDQRPPQSSGPALRRPEPRPRRPTPKLGPGPEGRRGHGQR
jgi:hypothetical protein